MILIDKALAARMECCIKKTHIEVTNQYSNGKMLEINGGAACFSGFDSFLSQVVGWGFTTKPKQFRRDIELIERFYHSLSHSRIDIELCPFAGNDLAQLLSHRGYRISELNNVSVIDLNDYRLDHSVNDVVMIKIRQVGRAELSEWSKRVALGFGYPEAQDQFFRYANALGTVAFAAYHQDKIIAGATVAIHGDVCDFGVTSTLPAYRGKGLQKKLLSARLDFVKREGLDLATVTTEPGTISDLNVQKTGFRYAYTRIKMTLGAS